MEKGETPEQNVIKEVYEETNYVIKKANLVAHCIAVSTTQMNECVYNYVVNIDNCKQVNKKTGDGTIFERVSKNVWVSEKELQAVLTNTRFPYLSSLASTY
jgi:8-oxo-dGTP pyrophosphatase MutT (NUDIX family)